MMGMEYSIRTRRWLTNVIVALLAIAGLTLGRTMYVRYSDGAAHRAADEMCRSIHVGEELSSVRAKMDHVVGRGEFVVSGSKFIESVHTVVGPVQYICYAKLSNGKVTESGVMHVSP
jgi:hypothetical protein